MELKNKKAALVTVLKQKQALVLGWTQKLHNQYRTWLYLSLTILLLGIFTAYISFFDRIHREKIEIAPAVLPYQLARKEKCESLIYKSQKEFEFASERTISDPEIIDDIHLNLSEIDYFKSRHSIDDDIRQLLYTPKLNKVVYLTGKEDIASFPDHLREVKVFDISANQAETIFAYQTDHTREFNYEIDWSVLRSISLSPDGTRVMIITDQELFLYNLETKDFEFSHDGRTPNIADVYPNQGRHFFQYAILSPDNQQAMLAYGYYEGVQFYLLDFASREITDLNMGGYVFGSFPQGWLENQIVYLKTSEPLVGNQGVELCFKSTNAQDEQCATTDGSYTDQVVISDNKIYFLQRWFDENQALESCNNIERIFEFNPQFDVLREHSSQLESRDLLSYDSTRVSGVKLNSKLLEFVLYEIDGQELLLLKLQDENESIIYAFLDPQLPDKLIRIVSSN